MLIGIDASRAILARRTGTETYSLRLIEALLRLGSGHRFRLYVNQAPLTPQSWGEAGPPKACPERSRRVGGRGAIFRTDFARESNVELRAIPFPRLWTHVRLSAEMLLHPPDVLFVPAHVLPLIHPRRSVVTVHDLGYLFYPEAHRPADRLYLDLSTRWNAHQAAAVLADSQATKADLVRAYGADPAKIHVVYLGRDEALTPVRDPEMLQAVWHRYGIGVVGAGLAPAQVGAGLVEDPRKGAPAQVPKYLLYVGTLQPRKNLARLIEAFARLAGTAAFADVQLVLAGGTPSSEGGMPSLGNRRGRYYDELLGQVQRLGLAGRVLFPGYIPEEDLPALYSGALAFVFPSLYEGFGLPVLEAGACGVPVITSNTSSLPEVAGDAALLVDPHDVDAIADAMHRLVTDEALRQELIRRGLENVKRFSWEKCARETLAVIEAVADPKRSRPTAMLTSPQSAIRNPQSPIPNPQSPTRILGIRVDALTYADLLERIADFIAQGTPHQICTVNPEFVMEARRNAEFRDVLERADLCLADGVGLLWAARRLGHPLPERVTGSDGVPLIAQQAAQRGWRLYLLGAAPGVADRTAQILSDRYRGLQIVGTYAGSPAAADAAEIIGRVRQARPDVLFVAYGAPAQDLWIARHRDALGVPVMMGVGGAFDHIAGVRPRAPLWVRRLNLEWLFRLITQPWRWRRQLALPRFVWAVLREKRD